MSVVKSTHVDIITDVEFNQQNGGYKMFEKNKATKIIRKHKISADEVITKDNSSFVTSGVQQIMIGSLCDNYDHALQVLLNIKAAGYDGIELNDFMIHKTAPVVKIMTQLAGMPIGNGGNLDWHKLIEESNLQVISLHSYLNTIEENPKSVADEAKSFGTDYVVITGMYRFDYSDESAVKDLASRLNKAGAALAEYGVHLLYHNHNCELQKVNTKQTAYDIIVEETDEAYVNFELDTYWIADGGADVTDMIEKLGNRMVMWHINDRGCTEKGPYLTPILKENATELGNGNMNLEKYSNLAKSNGVKYVILETHQNWIDNDPIKSLIISSDFFKKNL